MQAGPLRHVIDIEYYAIGAQDTDGQPSKSWIARYTGVRAAIRDVSGRELYVASEKLAEATTRITTRYLTGVTEGDRAVHDGPTCCGAKYEIFDIISIADKETKHAQLILTCKTGFTQG